MSRELVYRIAFLLCMAVIATNALIGLVEPAWAARSAVWRGIVAGVAALVALGLLIPMQAARRRSKPADPARKP